MDEAAAHAYRLLIADVYELAGRSRAASEAIARRHGQTVARWNVLSVLDGQDVTVAGVARRLGQARQSVQRVAGDLIAASCVRPLANPDHRRSPLLQLTSQGRRQLRVLTADADQDRAGQLAAAGVTAGQLDQAREVLGTLIGALGC
jgi:DNA-binding MarR family transcriptional regulator